MDHQNYLLSFYEKENYKRVLNRIPEDFLRDDLIEIKSYYNYFLNECMESLEEKVEKKIITENVYILMCDVLKTLNSSYQPNTLLLLIRKLDLNSPLLFN